ncbi:phosphatase 2C-like domain-containing protein [Mycena epipterygia]|nr:phosphatase 2C-like domain-containing protein [Mycena epipterygia]
MGSERSHMSEPFSNLHIETGENERLHYYVQFQMCVTASDSGVSAMEDTSVALLELDAAVGSKSDAFFGVYDGHSGSVPEMNRCLPDGIALIADNDSRESLVCGKCEDGSTTIAALVTADTLFVTNAGDSRAIMSVDGKAKVLSVDHDCGLPDYLRAARGFGDFPFKMCSDLKPEAQVVTARPDILSHAQTAEDKFLILAQDGIWDCLLPPQVMEFVRHRVDQGHDLASIAHKVTGHCLVSEPRLLGQDRRAWRWSIKLGPQDIDGITFVEFAGDIEVKLPTIQLIACTLDS